MNPIYRLLSSVENFFSPVFKFISFFFAGVAAVFKAMHEAMTVLVMLPYEMIWASRLGDFVRDVSGYHDPLAKLKKESTEIAEKHADKLDPTWVLLIKGELEKYAKTIIDPVKYAWAYKNAPDDLERSIVIDGRVVGGADLAPNVAPQVVTEDFVRRSWTFSVEQAAKMVYQYSVKAALAAVVALVLVTGLFMSVFVDRNFLSNPSAAMQSVASELESRKASEKNSVEAEPLAVTLASDMIARSNALRSAIQVADIFDQADLVRVAEEQRKADLKAKASPAQSDLRRDSDRVESARSAASTVASFAFAGLLLAGIGVLLAYVGFRYFQISIFRGMVYGAAVMGVADVQLAAWREAIQRASKRAENNEKELRQYNAQLIEVTERDKSPVYTFGKSQGILAFRGHPGGIPAGQSVAQSFMDMNQHTLGLGGTGMGKTLFILIPRIKWLLEQLSRGRPVSMFVLDNKGALVRSVARLLNRAGLDKSMLRVIGTGENELRINPCDGLTPAEIGDLLVSVMSQSSGGADESAFWTESGKNLVINIAVLAQAFECLEAGRQWGDKTGFRPYSFLGLFVLMSDDAQLDYALECVAKALQTEDRARIAHLEGISMSTGLTWLATSWKTLADVTKSGVQANAQRMLVSFVHYEEIAQGFATGRGDNLVSPRELMGAGVTGLNISQIKFGAAGRLIGIALKTMWFKFARESQINDPDFADVREQWWRYQERELEAHEMDAYAMRFFIADEYQAMMTAGGDLSDTDIWNEIRSAGVCGLIITQSLSSIEYALGREGSEKFLQNFNTRIFLGSIDKKTFDFATEIGGKVQRFSVVQKDQYESIEALRQIKRIDPDRLPEANFDAVVKSLANQQFAIGLRPFHIPAFKAPFVVDRSGMEQLSQVADSGVTWRDFQAADFREEDKNISILQSGETTEDAVTPLDITRLGKGNALIYLQRGGMPRIDFVTLNA